MEPRAGDLEINAASYAYPAVAADVRAHYATALEPMDGALGRLAEAGLSAFVLSTCLRIEVVVDGPRTRLDDALELLFGHAASVDGVVYRSGTAVVEHLFRVAAGLESAVLGEREISTQFRQAASKAVERGAARGRLVGLLDAAIATARASRRYLPSDPARSMATLAASLVGDVPDVAILGYGTMGRAVAEALRSRPRPPRVEVFVRRPETVDAPGLVVRSLDDAAEAIRRRPVVVSATSADTRLVPTEALRRLLVRRTDPLLLIDLAMPPDFEPPGGTPVRYVDIDDLADLARRAAPPVGVDRFVAEAAAEWIRRARVRGEAGALIRSLFAQADLAAAAVVDRFAGKLSNPADRKLLEQATRAAVRKLLHHPVRFIGDGNDETFAVLASAFGIVDDD